MTILSEPGEKLKVIVAAVLVAAVLVAGGYVTGRRTAPAKVVTQEHVVTTDDTEKVMQAIALLNQRIDSLATLNQQKDVHVVRVTEKDPNGVVKVTTTTDDHSKTEAKTQTEVNSTASTQVVKAVDQQVKQVEDKTVTVTNSVRPTWSFELQPGFNFAQALGSGTPYSLLPTSNPILKYGTIGFGVEHRFIGPLSLGVWANTNGAGGLSLRLDL